MIKGLPEIWGVSLSCEKSRTKGCESNTSQTFKNAYTPLLLLCSLLSKSPKQEVDETLDRARTEGQLPMTGHYTPRCESKHTKHRSLISPPAPPFRFQWSRLLLHPKPRRRWLGHRRSLSLPSRCSRNQRLLSRNRRLHPSCQETPSISSRFQV